MTNNDLNNLHPNCKRILTYLENTPDDTTQAMLRKKLNLSKRQVNYAMEKLRSQKLVNEMQVLGNMRTKHISINDSIVARLEITEMIRNV